MKIEDLKNGMVVEWMRTYAEGATIHVAELIIDISSTLIHTEIVVILEHDTGNTFETYSVGTEWATTIARFGSGLVKVMSKKELLIHKL